ncbi:DJ-1/PfpI family protein [Anabaena subtropica]|uniref:DJ-1/PfpI family protein n=1 Tax=Anabaena subtropica FACHB-260 TaxID=2692884 RepID=A0ABR8CP37_9NOST|nr:DJ-1/PfpI family protein [Anabaena subtropica]MBD2344323.1 DJ-1/PfpI family protein [Anabaena subtropica FACHB-260]
MIPRSLGGKKIAILVESEFIPEEIEAYQKRFSELKATVHLMSRLWDQPSVRFFSDEDTGNTPQTIDVNIDFQNVDVNDYAAVIMSANYTSVRLRYFEPPTGQPISAEQVCTSPAVQFYAQAMANPRIIKGALCHGLWILTPIPELLKGRQVICHEVVLADIINAGAIYTPSPSGVVVDGDLITGRSKHEVEAFIDAITEQIQELSIATNRFSGRRPTTSVSRLRAVS